jgi:3-dehydroquinate synthase
MPAFRVDTPHGNYDAVVQRGIIAQAAAYLPMKSGKRFVVSTEDVWRHQGEALARALQGAACELLFLPGGEDQKRLAHVETLAEEMVRRGADRTSIVIAFGGGIVGDMAGFLAAIFMRGIPVIQIPTTLLAQVDASVGGKTGVNLTCGKNLIGSFHQPLAVLIDPEALTTLPEREYRAGLWEVIKAGIIRDAELFRFLTERSGDVLQREPEAIERAIADSVRIKAEVVSNDERESGLRKILNLGHTFGHALEVETGYTRLLHGEAVAFGMRAAAWLAEASGHLSAEDCVEILETMRLYGPTPPLNGVDENRLLARLVHDKKTIQGTVHFVLPVRIGEAIVVSDVNENLVREAVRFGLS